MRNPDSDASLRALDRLLANVQHECRRADDIEISQRALNKLCDRQERLLLKVFNTQAHTLEGLAVKARAFLAEQRLEGYDPDPNIVGLTDSSRLGMLMAKDIIRLAGIC